MFGDGKNCATFANAIREERHTVAINNTLRGGAVGSSLGS